MHIMMTKEQFDTLKKKAKGGGSGDGDEKDKAPKAKDSEGKGSAEDSKGNGSKDSKDKGQEKLPKITLKEDDDTHGTLDTDDVMLNYYYNSQEGRLYLSIAKKHTLAAYCAGDNISGTYVMDILSQMPNPKKDTGGSSKADAGGGSESGEKKDQNQQPPSQQHQPEQHQNQ